MRIGARAERSQRRGELQHTESGGFATLARSLCGGFEEGFEMLCLEFEEIFLLLHAFLFHDTLLIDALLNRLIQSLVILHQRLEMTLLALQIRNLSHTRTHTQHAHNTRRGMFPPLSAESDRSLPLPIQRTWMHLASPSLPARSCTIRARPPQSC